MAGRRGYVEVTKSAPKLGLGRLWSLMECQGGAYLIEDLAHGGYWDAWDKDSHRKLTALPLGFYAVTATFNPPGGFTLKSVKPADPATEIERLTALAEGGKDLYRTTSPGIQFGLSSERLIRGSQKAKRDQTKGLLHALMERYR